jgi:hypothetical protein
MQTATEPAITMPVVIPAYIQALTDVQLRAYNRNLFANLVAVRRFNWCVFMKDRWQQLKAYAEAELQNRGMEVAC